MAMARVLPVTAPCTTAAIGRADTAKIEIARPSLLEGGGVGNGCSTSGVVLYSCCRLQFASISRRNAHFGLRGSSVWQGVGEDAVGLRYQILPPRKLGRRTLRISAQKNFDPKKIDPNNVIATLVKVGRQGLEAGTKLVPETVPRPVAQLGVGLAGLFLGSFVLRSLFSTVLFILAIGGLSYIAFLSLNKGEGGSSSGSSFDRNSGKPKSTDEALEEARKIMDKYK
ncbi:hypothetical protein R1sor_009349 [Riccia sorocarpa]|uniref:ATP synthase protein MI25 n=1 Tax=Riccia sorocarpa TaxID=122646 RepID=A0ABD3HV44_9MARC